VVSTGNHGEKYLQLVPDPCLRVVANASQTREDVEKLVRSLDETVEAVLCRNVFGLDVIGEDLYLLLYHYEIKSHQSECHMLVSIKIGSKTT
jgi:hypothetical protein